MTIHSFASRPPHDFKHSFSFPLSIHFEVPTFRLRRCLSPATRWICTATAVQKPC